MRRSSQNREGRLYGGMDKSEPVPPLALAEHRLPPRWTLSVSHDGEVLATYASPCGGSLVIALSSSQPELSAAHHCGATGTRIALGRGDGIRVRVLASALADIPSAVDAVDELLATLRREMSETRTDTEPRRPSRMYIRRRGADHGR
jgi:hypothetical protein